MPNPIIAGTILIEKSTLLPEPLRLETTPYSGNWAAITSPGRYQLDKELTSAGWTLFYMAGRIRTSAFGLHQQTRVRTAVRRAIVDVQSQRCNCVEIDDIRNKSFLGVPYVSVSAHPRHIQENGVFRGR